MHSSWPWPVAPCPRGARAAPTGNPRSRRRARPCSPPDETCRSERWPADLRRPCAAHRRGAPATPVGFRPGHAGRWVEEALAGIGVSGRFTWVDGETRTCVSILDRATAELTEIYEPSPAVGAGDWEALLALLDETMESHAAATGDGTIVTISGALPTGSPDDAFARVVATAHAWGARTLVDAYGPGLAAAPGGHPWLGKGNATEAG